MSVALFELDHQLFGNFDHSKELPTERLKSWLSSWKTAIVANKIYACCSTFFSRNRDNRCESKFNLRSIIKIRSIFLKKSHVFSLVEYSHRKKKKKKRNVRVYKSFAERDFSCRNVKDHSTASPSTTFSTIAFSPPTVTINHHSHATFLQHFSYKAKSTNHCRQMPGHGSWNERFFPRNRKKEGKGRGGGGGAEQKRV